MWFRKKTNTPFAPLTFDSGTLKSVSLDEWQALRAFYLRALKDHPTCSADDYQAMQDLAAQDWKAMIEQALIDPGSLLLAFTDSRTGAMQGIVYVKGRTEAKRSHESELHMYIMLNDAAPFALGIWQGIFAHLKSQTAIKRIKAAVHSGDNETFLLFTKLGFRRYGFDEQYYQIKKTHLDAVLLMKTL